MGLFQKACQTYDTFAKIAGDQAEGQIVLAPVAHDVKRAQLEIVIDAAGSFVSARAVDKSEPKIVIPVTEASVGRTVNKCAHPLCDSLGYLTAFDEEKHRLYVGQLEAWADSAFSSPKVRAVLAYVKGGTILRDLAGAGVIELTETGAPKDDKLLVRWQVIGLGEESGPCWTDKKLFSLYAAYYAAQKEAEGKTDLCMISGTYSASASQHLKGVVAAHGNAKLISANDSANFTYRGRFTDETQAAAVGYLASQKAHNALKWLSENQGVRFGERTFLCWSPQGVEIPPVTGFMRRPGADTEKAVRPSDYKKQLQDTLLGWKSSLPVRADVVIAAFDAATSGRLSVSYYSELAASDFLQRLYDWELSCCWENGPYGIESPALPAIISYAFGVEREGRFTVDGKIFGQLMQRLVACRVSRTKIPLDIEKALVNQCSRLGNHDAKPRAGLLFTTCAVIRKYYIDYYGREWNMALDLENKDRSYLFGRLLAIAESVERRTYNKDSDNGGERETNAMRLQSAFAQRPMSTWRVLEERLRPYYARLAPGLREHFKKLTAEIISALSADDPKLNSKLDDIYLLGYYHQRFFHKSAADSSENAGKQ